MSTAQDVINYLHDQGVIFTIKDDKGKYRIDMEGIGKTASRDLFKLMRKALKIYEDFKREKEKARKGHEIQDGSGC